MWHPDYGTLNRLFGTLLMMACLTTTHAREADTRVLLGLSVLDFDYEEFDGQGTTLDSEDGIIPGVMASIQWRKHTWFAESDVMLNAGWVDYSAPPNVTSRTHERIINWNMLAGHSLFEIKKTLLDAYTGIGYRDWRRNIRSTATRSGLLEQYHWWYWNLGLRGQQRFNQTSRLTVDARLLRPIDPEIDVQFKGVFDDITVKPQARNGFRVAVLVEHDMSPRATLWLSPWYEYWKLGASPGVALLQNGMPVVPMQVAREPESETSSTGITLGISWKL